MKCRQDLVQFLLEAVDALMDALNGGWSFCQNGLDVIQLSEASSCQLLFQPLVPAVALHGSQQIAVANGAILGDVEAKRPTNGLTNFAAQEREQGDQEHKTKWIVSCEDEHADSQVEAEQHEDRSDEEAERVVRVAIRSFG